MKGAIGFLYAEQEINEVSKIYGYGYGCVDNAGGTYSVGGPFDQMESKKIENTGARSLTFDDLSNLTGAKCPRSSDGTVDEGKRIFPTINTSSGYCSITDVRSGVKHDVVNVSGLSAKLNELDRMGLENRLVLDSCEACFDI